MPRAAEPGCRIAFGVTSSRSHPFTLACAHRPDGRRDPNCCLSRWEGRETRGIPLVVWENELHLPLTCGGSTFPTPSGGHSSPGVAARTWEPSGPSSREVELGGQWMPPDPGESASRCPASRRSPRRGERPRQRGPRLQLPLTHSPRRAPKG